jgi:hypothetical protein
MTLRSIRGCFLALLALLGGALPARATWSIVLVNKDTREIVFCGATCLQNFDFQQAVPVVLVGHGAAAAQSLVDTSGANRQLILEGFQSGKNPFGILQSLKEFDAQHQQRQYGIVDAYNVPRKFTGNGAGQAKKAIAGEFTDGFGRWAYSVQGNVLTGQLVIDEAVNTLITHPGDGSQKVMAAMETARALGGDGRCSCKIFDPTGCGAPPEDGFEKSAHIGTLIIARVGDTDGACGPQGCAQGDYFLSFNVIGANPDPDPVFTLQAQYDAWRATRIGKVDHVASETFVPVDALPADGASCTDCIVELLDIDGGPISAQNVVLTASSAQGLVNVDAIQDLGAGKFLVRLSAGAVPGEDVVTLVADEGQGEKPVTLSPQIELRIDAAAPLHVGVDSLSAELGGAAPFTLTGEPGAPYLLLGSRSGTEPGTVLPFGVLPLVPDGVLDFTLLAAGSPSLPDSIGLLDASGRATPRFEAAPGDLLPLVGSRLDWAAVVAGSQSVALPGPVGFDVLP